MPRELGEFTLSGADLGVGASLGNSALWVNTKGTGAIERVFANALGQSLFGTILLRYGAHGPKAPQDAYVSLGPDGGRRSFEIHPAYQRMRFTLGGGIGVSETTFVPLAPIATGWSDPPIVYITIEIHNARSIPVRMRMVAAAWLRGSMAPDVRAHFEKSLNALVAENASGPGAVRIFGLDRAPTSFDTTFDFGAVYDPNHIGTLVGDTDASGDVLGRLQVDLNLNPGERTKLTIKAGAFASVADEAIKIYAASVSADDALQKTVDHLRDVLHTSEVLTPDPAINQGAFWSKVNMRRVMAAYPQGLAFTNDPGSYANVVVRDCAWFVLRLRSLHARVFARVARQRRVAPVRQRQDARVLRRHHGRVEDDGLNINDDTPLFILAVNHHFRSTGDREWLAQTSTLRCAAAAKYIISQIDERGLVFLLRATIRAATCGRSQAGATSSNATASTARSPKSTAECVAALRAASHLAENIGRP